jgi:8-oxo-dGTP pyrophosphatase MutT (NUDIX family)
MKQEAIYMSAKFYYEDLEAPFPHCGISFGAVNIIYHQNKILLEKRSDSGQWGFISGRMELDESMIDAAIRETFEETGIKQEKEDVVFLGISDNPSRIALYPDGNCFRIISAVFKSECNSLSMLEKSNESIELRLFDLEEIFRLDIVETHIDILNYL